MIDIEVDIFDKVYTAMAAASYTGTMVSEYEPVASSFPHISLIELEQHPDMALQTQSGAECFAVLTYEVQVYALSKAECRNLSAAIDNIMMQIGFTPAGSGMQFIRNLADPTIFRMVGRYTAETDGRSIYRKT